MKDPNLQKIIDTNINNIKKNKLGTVIVQANSYLTYIYCGKQYQKKQQELDDFIGHVKFLSNEFKIQRLRYKVN